MNDVGSNRESAAELPSERFEAGREVRSRVVGEDYVRRALEGADDFDRDWQRILTESCWGEVWTGTALSDRQRSLRNLCILAALNRQHEFEVRLRGALRNGCTPPRFPRP
jgi:4-carboxymuconolactone decarboxylase